MMRILMMVGMALALSACSGAREEPAEDGDTPQPEMRAAPEAGEPTVAGTDTTAEGLVQVVGSDPNPQVVLSFTGESGPTQIGLSGDLAAELGRLHGITVAVSGDAVANPQGMPARAIDVVEYDILSVNEEPAYLGILAQRDGEWWLEREDALRLVALPVQLSEMAGAKIWIAGPMEGNAVRVQSYGIVAEP